ncbi:MAG TPA: ATP-grasp domain-containing protein [Pseudolabrys sp.]|jgi:predicted ATP-grasp superfamily ATP-dependent carboligase
MNFMPTKVPTMPGIWPSDPQSAPGALIVGGAHVSIGIARSLGRHGIPVWLMANHPLPTYSRYVKRSFPWPGADHAEGLSSIIDLARQHGLHGWVLIATGDQDMRMIAQNHALLSQHFRVATPDWDTIQWAYDKRLTYSRARSLGIDFPASFHSRSLAEIERFDCRFPVVLKPAFRKGMDEFTQAKAWKADDRDQLVTLYKRAAALVGDEAIIVQEWIPGSGEAQYSYAGLWERGEQVVALAARRRRQHPIDFGRSSTFVETVEQTDIEELACRFLKSLHYTGVAEIEFKHDRRDGHYKLLDVNTRFWTWNGLGALAGVDFPYLAWRQALGATVMSALPRRSVAWMHTSRDIIAAYEEISNGTLSVREYLRNFTKPLAFASFAFDDPLPAIVELPVAAWNRFASKLKGWRRYSSARDIARRRLAK